jgi:hypothetical protein
MRPGRLVAVASSLAALVLACGGKLSDDPGSSGSSSSGGSSSGGSSSGGSSSGDVCTSSPVGGNRACVPGTARANAPITVEVDATDGCLGCDASLEPCRVSVVGERITLAMTARVCQRDDGRECPAVCMIPSVTCALPALPPGAYTVDVAGEGQRIPPRTLVVATEASETSCALASPGSPSELDGAKYPRACSTDDDCMLATFGNACQPCHCPSAAITKGASDEYALEYEAERRARSSQCATRADGIACGACAPVKAECEIEDDALTGTCTLVPGF